MLELRFNVEYRDMYNYYETYCQPLMQYVFIQLITYVLNIFVSTKKAEMIQYFVYLLIVIISYFEIFNAYFTVLNKERGVKEYKRINTLGNYGNERCIQGGDQESYSIIYINIMNYCLGSSSGF